jgi:eukaryotic-like serine/threonine-protein kinase
VARAYPNGKAPDEIQQAVDRVWEVAASAARLEGELASHSRKLEAIERRGRALRAEIGRKVEELAEEESRALRDAAAERERSADIRTQRDEAERRSHEARRRQADEIARATQDTATLRKVFEEAGRRRCRGARPWARSSKITTGARPSSESYAAGLRKQIDELKAQLQRYSEALENDLQAGRDRIATRVREALGYEKTFTDASSAAGAAPAGAPRVPGAAGEPGRGDAPDSTRRGSGGADAESDRLASLALGEGRHAVSQPYPGGVPPRSPLPRTPPPVCPSPRTSLRDVLWPPPSAGRALGAPILGGGPPLAL